MKLLIIIHSIVIEAQVMEALRSLEIDSYTRLPVAYGKGGSSEPKFDDVVWPGHNSILLVVAEDGRAAELMSKVAELRREFRSEGIKAFMLPVDAAT